MQSFKAITVLGLAATLLAGCAGPDTFRLGGREHPEWVLDPKIAREEYPDQICGTGIGSDIKDPGLARDSADQHSYIRIAEQLGLEAAGHLERRGEFHGDSSAERTRESTDVAGVRVTDVDMLMKGVEVKKRWISDQGTWYSMACLAKENLDETTRNLIEERFDAALERVRAQSEGSPDVAPEQAAEAADKVAQTLPARTFRNAELAVER